MPHIADGHKHHSSHQVVERDYFQVKINDADDNGDGQHVYAASQRAVTCQTKAPTDLDGFVHSTWWWGGVIQDGTYRVGGLSDSSPEATSPSSASATSPFPPTQAQQVIPDPPYFQTECSLF